MSIKFTANTQNGMANTRQHLPRAPLALAREGKQIPKAIRARVNRLAHSRAQQHAEQVRDAALAELQAMVDAGADIDALCVAVAAIENDRPA